MRVTNQFISTLNACALYNKGVSRVVVPVACNANKVRELLKRKFNIELQSQVLV